MQISLASSARRLAFGCCVILAVAEFAYLSSRAARAHAWAEGIQQSEIERAVALEPRNPEYWYKLGRWHFLVDQDSATALNAYNAAVQQNPHIARYYIEIARLSLFLDDRQQLTQALDTALRVDPTTPSVNWEAANLFLAANKADRALPLFRTASASSWEYRSPAISSSWNATHDVDRMVSVALPQNVETYSEFLRYLVSRHESAAADRLWAHFIGSRLVFPVRASFPYLDLLVEQHRVADASRAWKQMANVIADNSYLLPNDNLIVNPGFEHEILDGGFDWRISRQNDVAVEITSSDLHDGGHCLLISFDTSRTGTAGVYQLIPVEPSASYLLSMSYKADGLDGAHGISAVVSDAFTGQSIAATEELLGSSPWREIGQSFTAGPSTTLISLEFKRPAGSLIRGRLLIDDVRLVRK